MKKINITSSKLTDAPYTKATESAFVFEEDTALQQLKLELENAQPGCYLISGYRGSGKTSFINRVKAQVTGFMIVDLNIPQKEDYPILVKKIIRQLYLTYTTYAAANNLETKKDFEEEFQLLYDRTFNDITHSQLVSVKDERKSEQKFGFDYKKLIPYLAVLLSATGITFLLVYKWAQYLLFAVTTIWACVTDVSQTWTRTKTKAASADLSRKSLYDNEIAEHHLFATLQKLKENGIKIMIVFDELDKLQDDQKISDVISNLKPLLLSGYGSFVVVAGQSVYYELEKSNYMDDLVISTLFSRSVHVPFLKNAALQKYYLGLITDDADKSVPLVNDFFNSLILKSGRIPRKLVNLIRSVITWEAGQATILIDENLEVMLRWKSRVLEAASAAIDNKLAGQTRNPVQLDFCTAQSFIWLGKMLEFTLIPFTKGDIFKLEGYDKKYPESYINSLSDAWTYLIEQLATENLLKVTPDAGDKGEIYSWIFVEATATDEGGEEDSGGAAPEDEPPVNGGDGQRDLLTLDVDDQLKQSLFLTDFAELEAYIRQLYLELEPGETSGTIPFRSLVEKLSTMGVMGKAWGSSARVKQLIDTRNKLSHGLAVGVSDLDEVRSSTKNMGRLRSELNEAFTYFIVKLQLQNYKVEKSTKGGFDFLVIADYFQIAFEVKSSQNGTLDTRIISEVIDKYSNYTVINKQPLQYVLFYFQPPGRKSMDDFFMNFDTMLSASFPEHQRDIHLTYITTANQGSIREQIEETVQKVIQQIQGQQMQ